MHNCNCSLLRYLQDKISFICFSSLRSCQAPASESTESICSALPLCDSPAAASVLAPVSASPRIFAFHVQL